MLGIIIPPTRKEASRAYYLANRDSVLAQQAAYRKRRKAKLRRAELRAAAPQPVAVAHAVPAFKIEKGVPLPAPGHGMDDPSRPPFATLKVGESFLFTPQHLNGNASPTAKANLISHVSAQAINLTVKVRPRPKFTARTVVGGVRVWRIE